MTTTQDTGTTRGFNASWRVIDIITAAVLGVAIGLIFLIWNSAGVQLGNILEPLTPGLAGLAAGIWLLGGVVGGLVIRKPGAAFLVETIAALLSTAVGNIWGWETMAYGLAQGLAAELIFAVFLYRRWNLLVAMLAGAAAGLACAVVNYVLYDNQKSAEYLVIYFSTCILSGAVLAGALGWALVKALAQTGVLSRFASGRQQPIDLQ